MVPHASATSTGRSWIGEVRLLGSFRLIVDGADVALPTGSQRLVALLALHGRQTRSRAAGTLWPDATEVRALGCLRTAIWRCHQGAPGVVQAGSTSLHLSAAVSVDCVELASKARAVIDGGSGDPAGCDGELLSGWDDDWLADERERLNQLQLHMLEAQAQRLAADGRFGLALDAAMRAVRADPLRESAHRTVISIHLAEGNVAQARRALRRCADLLHSELGVGPSAQTMRLMAGALTGSGMGATTGTGRSTAPVKDALRGDAAVTVG